MSKRNKACYIIGTILIIGSIVLLATTFLKAKPHDDRQSITIYYEEGKDAPVSGVHNKAPDEPLEAPSEAELIALACVESIGTETELETIGYNMTYVMQVITAEGGTDQDMCLACAQALFNTCVKLQAKYNPEEVCEKYQYTQPASFISDEARYACEQIFLYGNIYEKVEDATIFYNPKYGWSAYHESQEFVCEINGVNFYREVTK